MLAHPHYLTGGAKIDAGNPDSGPMVLPAQNTLMLSLDGKTLSTTGTVPADPRSPTTHEQLSQTVAFALRARAGLDRMVGYAEVVRAIRAQTLDL